jgi:N-acetylglucosaminyl-diphospho-decaprenol L-rhamnosyltransferase
MQLVSVVIVNYETSEYVRRCVPSLRAQDEPCELLIVDNPSLAEDWRNVQLEGTRLIRNATNVGYGLACNTGAAAASPESGFICILNPDTIVPAGALAQWVNRHNELLPAGGLLAPCLLNENGRVQRSAYKFPGLITYWVNHSIFAGVLKEWRKGKKPTKETRNDVSAASGGERDGHPEGNWQAVDWVMGAAMLVDRQTWQQLGGFSDRYFLYAEDMDLCYRLRQHGKRVIYDPTVCIVHTQGEPPPELRHIGLVRLFAGLKIFLSVHYGRAQLAAVSSSVILDMLVRIILFSAVRIFRPRDLLLRNRLRGAIVVLKLFLGANVPQLQQEMPELLERRM